MSITKTDLPTFELSNVLEWNVIENCALDICVGKTIFEFGRVENVFASFCCGDFVFSGGAARASERGQLADHRAKRKSKIAIAKWIQQKHSKRIGIQESFSRQNVKIAIEKLQNIQGGMKCDLELLWMGVRA